MRFRTRAFLLCFVPFAVLLTGSFWTIQKLVQSTVREGLRTSLRENHLSIARLHARNNLQSSRFLKVVGENASLKAGIQLLASYPGSTAAKQTVEDQLQELCQQMGFDVLMISDVHGTPLAGVIRVGGQLAPIPDLSQTPPRGFMMQADKVYQMASIPIDQGEENLGELSVGERFDFSEFNTPAVLIRNGQVLQSSLAGVGLSDVQAALAGCPGTGECEIRLAGNNYISLPLQSISLGDGYLLRSLQNVDSATGPVQAVLNRVFLIASIGIVLAALMCSVFSSRSIVQPIAAMIAHLRRTEGTGVLPEFQTDLSSIREIRDLTASFNHAAATIREARQSLQHAYVEFIGSLANALDARDRYTAGHSHRVSDLACATAAALGVPSHGLQEIRVGALLHDIGKIGISDTVLQKTGQLTEQEFALIKQHPVIGRRILEGVQGFAPYLAAVELHHENWDGSGYPRGQSGETTPIAARIIHVSDAYDAMTTDRPYRKGMSHSDAIRVLREFAGRHFDPRVVEVFTNLPFAYESSEPEDNRTTDALVVVGCL
jgi:HD-GYP domain-containing protein (c-di-GMP phosphodiesterase class II)